MHYKLRKKITFFLLVKLNFVQSLVFTPLEKLNLSTTYSIEFRSAIRQLQQEQDAFREKRYSSEQISNLNKVLKKFVYLERYCFITINNYKHLDLLLEVPSLLRTPKLGVAEIDRSGYDGAYDDGRHQFVWFLEHIGNSNQTQSFTKYLPGWDTQRRYHKHNKFRYHIKLLTYLVNIKPWSCEVEVSLRPPLLHSPIIHPPRIWEYQNVNHYVSLTLPSLVPKIYVMINNHVPHEDEYIRQWMISMTEPGQSDADSGKSMKNSVFLQISGESLLLLQADRQCTHQNLTCEIIPRKKLSLDQLPNFQDLSSRQEHPLKQKPSRIKKQQLNFDDEDFVHRQDIQILESITGNISISFVSGDLKYRQNLNPSSFDLQIVKMDVPKQSDNLPIFPVQLNDDFNSLTFVACGIRGVTPLQFRNLVVIYDCRIWFYIFVILIVLPIEMRNIGGVGISTTQHFFSLIKILLEQGSALKGRRFGESRLRWIASGFLLAATVLSGAYKRNYSGLRSLTGPRGIMKYKTIDKLWIDKFTIYTRIGELDLGATLMSPIDKVTLKVLPHEIRGIGDYPVFHIASELHLRQRNFESLKSHVSDETLKITSLHPGLASIVKQNLGKLQANGLKENPEVEFRKTTLQAEDQILLQYMRTCRQSALILPRKKAAKYALLLNRMGPISVSLGREEYYKADIGFIMRGLVSPQIVKRIRFSTESGIWTRWSKIMIGIQNHHEEIFWRYPRHVTRPSMRGNIIVIFILLGFGMGMAILVFLVEELGKLLGMLRSGMMYWNYGITGIRRRSTVKDTNEGDIDDEITPKGVQPISLNNAMALCSENID